MRIHRIWIGIACLLLAAWAAPRAADTLRDRPGASETYQDARALGAKIDRLLAETWAEAKVVPARPVDDAGYLRRVSLDLAGRIPTSSEAREFLDDPAPDKRARLVDRLLEGPSYAANAPDLWRQILLPRAESEGHARFDAPAFGAWLRGKLVEDVGYDEMVREILTAKPGARTVDPSNVRAERSHAGLPIAAQGASDGLAPDASRVFLGARLDCAQCHNLPFSGWRREDFWGLAAFFVDDPDRGTTEGRRPLSGVVKSFEAGDLDGPPPTWNAGAEPREALADRITSPGNAPFARAAVNRVWAHFFGSGLVERGDEGAPSHPELLDELAHEFVSHDFQLKFLIRALTASKAYGLSCAVDHPGPASPHLFNAMPERGLSPGQLHASLALATGVRDDLECAGLESGDTLAAVAEAPYLDAAGRVEELHLAALTRRPRPEESAALVASIEEADTPEGRLRALADAIRAILNSPEFRQRR